MDRIKIVHINQQNNNFQHLNGSTSNGGARRWNLGGGHNRDAAGVEEK